MYPIFVRPGRSISQLDLDMSKPICSCDNCGNYCTLPKGMHGIHPNAQQCVILSKGHPQREHETGHGSMSRVKWMVEGQEGATLEANGEKFVTNDDGAPMMCNFYCADLGRHVHVDYCRSANPVSCSGADIQHISTRVHPNPERAKDWITHSLHWKRMGGPLWYPPLILSLTSLQVSKACNHNGASM